MASIRAYSWRQGDDIWGVAARFLADAGWNDVGSFVDAIKQANLGPGTAQVTLWGINPLTGADSVPINTVISLPHASN